VKRAAVFGAADGLVLVLGLIAGFAAHPAGALRPAVFAGIAECVGMTAAMWLSDSASGFWPAAGCGAATLAGCTVPVAPYLAGAAPAAVTSSLILVAAVAAVIAWLRPEKGTLAAVQTYGVLTVAAAACWAVSLM